MIASPVQFRVFFKLNLPLWLRSDSLSINSAKYVIIPSILGSSVIFVGPGGDLIFSTFSVLGCTPFLNGYKKMNLFLVHCTFVTIELETFIFMVFIRQCRFWPYPVFVLLYTITSSISPMVSLHFSKMISILCWNMLYAGTLPDQKEFF